VGEGAEVDPAARLVGPLYIGDFAKVEAGAELRAYSVLGTNVVMRSGAFCERSVVHDNVFIGPHANLRGCVVGKNTDIKRAARLEEGSVVGDECVVEEEAILAAGVKVYPFKTIEAGAVLHTSVIWESRGLRRLFGPRGVSGIVNVDITPDLVVRLASAYATTLPKGATVTLSRDHSRAARALTRAAVSALNASAINCRDLEATPPSVTRLEVGREGGAGGMLLRTSPGVPDSVDIQLLDEHGADLSGPAARRLEQIFQRQDFRRAFPGEIGDLTYPPRAVESYVDELIHRIGTTGVQEAGLRVVVDAAGGITATVLPMLLGRLPVEALVVNNHLDDALPTETASMRVAGLARLGGLVASSKAAFGVRFDPVGERLALVDDTGVAIEDGRALLVALDLVAAERRGGKVALPVTTTRVAEDVCRFHGVEVVWTVTAPGGLARASELENLVFAGDGRGGFVVPELGDSIDAFAAFVRLAGLVARAQLTLSQIDARIPRAHVVRRDVPTPWARKGQVMRTVLEAAADRTVDLVDGVRVVEGPRRWTLILPDPAEAVTRLWAEGRSLEDAEDLLEEWTAQVESASR